MAYDPLSARASRRVSTTSTDTEWIDTEFERRPALGLRTKD